MARPPKAGGRLRNPRPEQDAPADTKARDSHRGMCSGYLGAIINRFRELLRETQFEGTRIHKEDARQMNLLVLEFETEMRELIKGVRIQQHGVRDLSVAIPAASDLSNVVAFRTR